jgi:Zn finger protein HypA/HybF involved in hydrogenase expression
VEAGGPGGADEIGHYVDWTCPRCELVSLQARHAPELMCPGCLHRRPFSPQVLGLGPVTVKCGSCAHAVPLGAGKLDARCEACGSTVRRVARTGSAEQALTRELLAASGAASPSEGTLGTPVTPENRAELVLLGLARQANWYGRVIQLPRYLEVVRRSLPELADAERARRLARVAELSAAETSDAAGRELVEQARVALSGR